MSNGRSIPHEDAAEAWQDVMARAFQCFALYHWRTRIHGDPRASTDPAFALLQNAALESSLMSIRDLDDFFASRSGSRSDDIIAVDYGFPSGLGFLSPDEREAINKKLAHLTYRAVYEHRQNPTHPNPRTWNNADLANRAMIVFGQFLDHLEASFFANEMAQQGLVRTARGAPTSALQNLNALARQGVGFPGLIMALPINIQDLFTGRVVEWERLEFKEGWNPEAVVRSVCAFANDFHNWGGGYLIIGVAEHAGKPILPPRGLEPEQVDAIQKSFWISAHKIRPTYHPVAVPATIQGKLVLIIWVPGGDQRPYKAPASLAKDNKEWAYYIRRHSNSVEAKGAGRAGADRSRQQDPFLDDRVNQRASVGALQPGLVQSFLTRVKSDLAATAGSRPLPAVAQDMHLLGGPPEAPFPLNVGLMFFTPKPADWFPGTQIDLVQFPRGAGGGDIIERSFAGPLDVMLQEALAYCKNNLLVQYTHKRPDQAEGGALLLEAALCGAGGGVGQRGLSSQLRGA